MHSVKNQNNFICMWSFWRTKHTLCDYITGSSAALAIERKINENGDIGYSNNRAAIDTAVNVIDGAETLPWSRSAQCFYATVFIWICSYLPNAPKTLKSPQHSREERKSMRKSLSRLSLSVIKSHHHNQNPFQISSHFNGNPPKIPSTISHELNPFLLHTKKPILSLQVQAFLHIFCRFGKYPGGGSWKKLHKETWGWG